MRNQSGAIRIIEQLAFAFVSLICPENQTNAAALFSDIRLEMFFTAGVRPVAFRG